MRVAVAPEPRPRTPPCPAGGTPLKRLIPIPANPGFEQDLLIEVGQKMQDQMDQQNQLEQFAAQVAKRLAVVATAGSKPRRTSRGRQPSPEALAQQKAIRKIFAGTPRGKRKPSRKYCKAMDTIPGIETKESWQNRSGVPCPRKYVKAWDYPTDPDARRAFHDLIGKENSPNLPQKRRVDG